MKIAWGKTFDNPQIDFIDGRFYLSANEGLFDIKREVVPVVERIADAMRHGANIKTVCEDKFFASHIASVIARNGDYFADKIGGDAKTMLLAFLTLVDLCKGHEAFASVCTNNASCPERLVGY